jgi:hypothetical protein
MPNAPQLVALTLLIPALSPGALQGSAAPAQDGKPKPSSKRGDTPAAAPGKVEKLDALGLTLSFPAAFAELERHDPGDDEDEDELGRWTAKLGAKRVILDVEAWKNFAKGEPSDITWRIHDFVREDDYEGPSFDFVEHRLVPGAYGYAPYASLLWGSILERGTTKDIGNLWFYSGVTETTGYLITLEIQPVASAEDKQLVLDFLAKGIAYSGKARDPKWTEDEVDLRWKDDSALDKKEQKDLKVIRTAHYVVMTNSSGGDNFAKQMEINYGIIQKTFPFPEVPGRRLMPVFLFQNPEEYYAFCVKRFKWSAEEAEKSKGVASGDFYATWYEAPQDPVHIHEATHQIFSNRLELDGGGSWYQEGVAEYIETKPNERNDIARRVKNGKHTPLKEFMRLESLLMSSEDDVSGDSAAGLHYKQAALVIEFLRESKFGKDKFLEWLHAMGNTPDNDIPKIQAVFQRVYGVDIEQLDAELQKYCQKR